MKKIIYTYALACLFTESQALLVRPGITIWKPSYSCRNYLMLMAQKLERDGNLEKALTHCQTVWQQMPNKNEGRPIVKEIARLTYLLKPQSTPAINTSLIQELTDDLPVDMGENSQRKKHRQKNKTPELKERLNKFFYDDGSIVEAIDPTENTITIGKPASNDKVVLTITSEKDLIPKKGTARIRVLLLMTI